MKSIINVIKENISSLITAIIAIIAIWQTHKQIKINNKQFLFKNRVEKYTIANSLIQLYKDSESLLDYSKSKVNEAIIVDLQFENLTNIEYLKDITKIINETRNDDERVKFLVKLEEVKNLANEVKFLFNGNQGVLLNDFIYNYQNVLRELYKYQILQNLMIDNKAPYMVPKTYEQLQKEFGESTHRKSLYNAINQLKDSYNNLNKNKIIKKIEKDIKL